METELKKSQDIEFLENSSPINKNILGFYIIHFIKYIIEHTYLSSNSERKIFLL